MQVTLLSHANRGAVVKTRWGAIAFDRDGFAVHDVPEADLPMLRKLKWLVEDPKAPQPAPAPGPAPGPAPEPAPEPAMLEIDDTTTAVTPRRKRR